MKTVSEMEMKQFPGLEFADAGEMLELIQTMGVFAGIPETFFKGFLAVQAGRYFSVPYCQFAMDDLRKQFENSAFEIMEPAGRAIEDTMLFSYRMGLCSEGSQEALLSMFEKAFRGALQYGFEAGAEARKILMQCRHDEGKET